MKIGIVQLRQIIREECSKIIKEQMTVASKLSLAEVAKAIGEWGKYAIQSLIEDYEYYARKAGKQSGTDSFLSSLTLSIDEDGMVHLISTDLDLKWNDKKKKWEGFETGQMVTRTPKKVEKDDVGLPSVDHPDFDEAKFKANRETLKKYPGAIEGLKMIFNDVGFMYEDEEIDFPTYIGLSNVFIDNELKTVVINDPEDAPYVWNSKDKSWDVEDIEI